MKPSATELRIGFDAGLYSRDDVRTWIDAEIKARPSLPAALLELATIAHRSDDDVVALLKELEGEVPASAEATTTLAVLAELYRANKLGVSEAIHLLEGLTWLPQGLSEEELADIGQLVCALDLAEYGSYGTMEDVLRELEAFFAAYKLELSRDG